MRNKFYQITKPIIIFCIIALSVAINGQLRANPIDTTQAKKIAEQWWNLNNDQPCKGLSVESRYGKTTQVLYEIRYQSGGFVLIPADDYVIPILGYSFEGRKSKNQKNESYEAWIKNYGEQIEYIIASNSKKKRIDPIKYINEIVNQNKSTSSIGPLLTTTWNQGAGWNQYCPADNAGAGGHAYVGCVAVAMAQVMKYWDYPTTGVGSYSYNHSTYGTLSADFGSTTYNWSSMSDNSADQYNALLLYHCGVSVNMNYGTTGSSSSSTDARNALVNYFDYKTTCSNKLKYQYTNANWENLIKNNLDNGMPVFYSGGNGNSSHAFVCDGYQNSNYFHFNWGWGGVLDGYFYLSSLTAASFDFTSSQMAIVGIEPKLSNKVVLVEHFTQASNVACATHNLGINALLGATTNKDKVAHIAYHTSWPGIDPMYTFNQSNGQGDSRVTYYGVTGVPNCVLGGNQAQGTPAIVTQAGIDAEYAAPGFFNISGQGIYNQISNNLQIDVDIEAFVAPPSGTIKAQVVLVESINYASAPGTNGETYFPDVMRKMFPSEAGTIIANPVIGNTTSLSFTYSVQSPIDISNCHLVVFVQNETNKDIYMTSKLKVMNTQIQGLIAQYSSNVTQGIAPLTVQFTDETSGNPISWLWDFGDGFTSQLQNPTHIYQDTGSYTVSLIINDGSSTDTSIMSNFITVQEALHCGQITDYDGNSYNTIKIGDQCWMKENLKTTSNSAGNSITRYCYDNITTNCDTYGGLYDWNTIMDGSSSSSANPSGVQGICPTGWHLPSDAEWSKLIDFHGGWNVAGGKLKETGTTHWNSPNNEATNSSGFSALPGGWYNGSVFNTLNYYCYWWSSTQNSPSHAWFLNLYHSSGNISHYFNNKTFGYSVRCIKDIDLFGSFTLSTIDNICYGDSSGSIDITITGGSSPYNYSWSNGATSEDISGLAAGTYSLTITDAGGASIDTMVAIFEPAEIVVSANVTNISTAGASDGAIELTVSGGTLPYSYSWSNGGGIEDLSGLTADTYSLTLTDANGCTISDSYTVSQSSGALLVTLNSITHVSCSWGSDGAIDISVSGGVVPYSFAWSNGDATEDVMNLSDGTYTITVTDGNGTVVTESYSITEPDYLSVMVTGSSYICHGEWSFISTDVSGGTQPYTYLWSNGYTSGNLNGIPAGNYTLTVTDANGCTEFASQEINEASAMSVTGIETHVSCTNAGDGAIDLTVTGGEYPNEPVTTTYVWSNGATTEDLSGLAPGAYSVTVTNTPSYNWAACEESASFTITEPILLEISNSIITDVSTVGGSDGAIDITVSGGTMPYAFSWSNVGGTEDITGLSAGVYVVTVTDANGCLVTENFSIVEQGPFSCGTSTVSDYDSNIYNTVQIGSQCWMKENLKTTHNSAGNNITRYCYSNSTSNCDTYGGLYEWNTIMDGASSSNNNPSGVQGICPTGWHLPSDAEWTELTDFLGGTSVAGGKLKEAGTAHWSSPNTGATNSSGFAALPGGSKSDNGSSTYYMGTYGYFWSSTQYSSSEGWYWYMSRLSASANKNHRSKTYGYSVRCIKDIDLLGLSIISTTDNICFGDAGGAVDITITGGTSPYAYSWSNGATSEDVSGLAAGTYSLTITDAGGASIDTMVAILEPAEIVVSSSVTNVSTTGGNNGAIDIAVSGGTMPYAFSWSNGGVTEDLNGLTAGTYSLTVTDGNGCSVYANYDVLEALDPLLITLNSISHVSCSWDSDGAIDISVSGGLTPYTYSWSNGATSEDLNNLSEGTYTITVTDANGTVASDSYTINEPDYMWTMISGSSYICNGEWTYVDVFTSGGTPPYSYLWSNGETSGHLYGIPAGNYTLTITDANGCTDFASHEINEASAMSVTGIETHVSCTNAGDGAIDITVTGGVYPNEPLTTTYVWSNGATTEDLSGLAPGAYSVTVTNTPSYNWAACEESASFTITEPSLLEIPNSVITGASTAGASDGAIDVTVSGGTMPYAFSWSNGGVTEDLNGLTAGTYSLTVTDGNGCSVYANYDVLEALDPLLITLNSISHVSCSWDSDGAIDISVSGGLAPYTYSWSNGATSEDLNNLSGGTFTVTVTDANGIVANDSYTINEPDYLFATVHADPTYICNGGSSNIDVWVNGGTPPYTYLWDNGSASDYVYGVSGGTHYVTVTDANGCTEIMSGIVKEATPMVIAGVETNVSCNGATDGEIDITFSGGEFVNRPVVTTFNWSNGATTEDLSGLAPGVYTITITNTLNGNWAVCSEIASFTITQPDLLEITNSIITDVSTFGGSDGAIEITVSGGTMPYAFSWSNSGATEDLSGLSAGTYGLTVTDANGCAEYATYSVLESPDPLLITINTLSHVNCNGDSDGAIDISVSGGVVPYAFTWSNGATTEDLSSLTAGTYHVTIADLVGTSIVDSFVITEPPMLELTITGNAYICNGGSTLLSTTTVGGATPYSYQWNNGINLYNTVAAGGISTVTVTDAYGCTEMASQMVYESTPMVIASMIDSLSCFNAMDGEIDITVSGGQYSTAGATVSTSYLWSNGETTEDLSNIADGHYYVAVTQSLLNNVNTCIEYAFFDLIQPDSLQISNSIITDVSIFAGSDGAIDITVSGGTMPYSYSWSNGGATEDLTGLSAGTYGLTVTDANGCAAIFDFLINEPTNLSGCTDPLASNYNPSAITDDGSCVYYPDWTFNQASDNHTILISDTIPKTIDGINIDTNDFIGVFYDSLGVEKCGGYIIWQGSTIALAAWGEVNGNDGFVVGDEFLWKIWDSSEGTEHDAVATYYQNYPQTAYYATNGMSVLSSLTVITSVTQTINIPSGWSMISTYIDPFEPAIDSMFSDIVSEILIVKDASGAVFWPVFNLNMIGNNVVGDGYQVNAISNQTIEVTGTLVEPENTTFIVPLGWSIIGYLRTTPMDLVAVFSSCVSDLIIVKDASGTVYWPVFSLNMIGDMKPGKGYQINTSAGFSFTYPANATTFSKSNIEKVNPLHYKNIKVTDNNMTLGIPINTWETLPNFGDEVGVFSQLGLLVGSGVFVGNNMAIPIWGNDETTPEIDGMIAGEEFLIKLWDGETERIISVDSWMEGSNGFGINKIAIAELVAQNLELRTFELFQNSPNPFKGETEFSFYIPENTRVTFSILNVFGETIEVLISDELEKGKHSLKYHCKALAAGTYYYRLETPNFTETKKMVVVK